MNVFMLRRSNALILSYSFQLLHHFRFWRPFWIFRFQSFFDRKLLSKCANDAYFCSQEVKTYQIGYLTWKNSFICKKRYFRRPFCIFYPLVLPEVDNIANWVTIPNLNEEYYSHTKFKENRIKTVALTVLSFFRKRWRPWRHRIC